MIKVATELIKLLSTASRNDGQAIRLVLLFTVLALVAIALKVTF